MKVTPAGDRRRFALLALLLLAACGGDSEIRNADFVGTWQVDVPTTTGCWTAFSLQFVAEAADAAPSEGQGVFNMVSVWYLTSEPSATSPFSGHFSTDDFGFVFFIQGSNSLRMEGPAGTSRRVTGLFRDRDGVVFPAGCSAMATARRL